MGQERWVIDATELELEGEEGGAAAALSYRALWYWIDAQESQEGAKGSQQWKTAQASTTGANVLLGGGAEEGRNKQRGVRSYECSSRALE